MHRLLAALLCLPFAVSAAEPPNPDDLAQGQRWWKHVEFLAADRLEGRNTGSAGHRIAADYVAAAFKDAGLKPVGRDYLQPVPFVVRTLDESASRVEWLPAEGEPQPVAFGDEVLLSTRGEGGRTIEAEAVFAGYGLVVPEQGHDDLKGLDVRGKLVVYISGGPKTMPGNLKSHYSSAAERWKALKAAGAIGTVAIPNPKFMDVPWARQAANRLQPSMLLADPKLDDLAGIRAAMTLNPDKVDRFLAGSGHTFKDLLATIEADEPLPHFALPGRFRVRAAIAQSAVESQNVVAQLEGSDAKLRSEYVVLSAHLDHLGIAPSGDGDRIFNGAMDNASGVGWLLETARRIKASGARPRRSLVFVAVTGEEKGQQGSKFFAANPGLGSGRMVADINMDMVLPLFPLRYLEVQGLGESTLGDDIRAVCEPLGVGVQFDKEPDRNRFIRSDQYSFIKRGVPALAFKFGWLPGTPEEAIYRAWYRDRYHAVADDLNQPVDLEGAGTFTRLLDGLLTRVANADRAPAWKAGSFFERFAAPEKAD